MANKFIRVGVLATALAVVTLASCDDGGAARSGKALGKAAEPPKEARNPEPRLPGALTGQQLKWSACPAPSKAQGGGDAPGGDWQCATMKAPLDYKKPDGKTIDVALIRQQATGPDRRIGSLVFNFGGPGESGVATLPWATEEDYADLGARYDLVSFDPRGVGNTIPVSCGAGSEDSTDGEDMDVEAYNTACEKHSGDVLAHVGTSSTARDMDLLRQTLGEDKLNYFGISYGTELGGVYAHLFPKNVGRAVLDAAVDPTLDQAEIALGQTKGFQLALDHFTKDCAENHTSCPTGTDPAKSNDRLKALLDKLDEDPAKTDDGREVTSDIALTAIANFLYGGEDAWEYLVDALREVKESGTANELLQSADEYSGRYETALRPGPGSRPGLRPRSKGEPTANNSEDALTAITCADSDQRYDDFEVDDLIPKFEKASPIFGETDAMTLYTCLDWPVEGERSTPDVSAEGASPILVIGNTGDPATPFEGSKRMARELGEGVGVHLTVRGEGHGTYGVNGCATKKVDAFLLDGKVPEHGATCDA
ncbi:alpha/beta hydrolase [Streptomyces sp. NBC_01304]|uniref:alpha/beta hydrolase n=1 Tax=Streptomyces sp. NBC_01304 TaxID=2903818 RepID=UPI002E0DFDB3|nr:alpha/beta hydrolase [Streptomyces sp. NBC_01304]